MSIYKNALLIFGFLLFSFRLFSQYFPAQEMSLNYNSVCFTFPFEANADEYELTIYDNEPTSNQTYTTSSNKIILSDLNFGGSYYWKVKSISKNKVLSESPLNHFNISVFTKTDHLRFMNITKKKVLCSNELFIYDYAKVMIDHNTEVTWFLPDFLEGRIPTTGIRDLKMTTDGTFLCLIDSMGFEFDVNGKVLWKAPNKGDISHRKNEDYHHDIQKLANGNYMLLGNERIRTKFKGEKDSITYESGFIVEYTPYGEIAWFWKAKDFFTPELLSQRKKPEGTVNPATHMNSFHVDGEFVYVGFRDASWIIKVDKKTKKVVELYGGHDSGLPNHYATELFRFQHDTEVLPDLNAMAIINNDSIADSAVVSSMLLFSLGDLTHKKGELLFKFPFKYDNRSNGKSQKLGNVTQLNNGNYLINMGALNRVVEIQSSGEIVWDSFTDKYDSIKHVWRPFQQYRVASTSSLYPNEFSVKLSPLKSQKDKNSAKMTIYNVGSENFSYKISIFSQGRYITLVEQTDVINSSEESTIPISFANDSKPEYMEIKAIGSNKSIRIPFK